MCRLALIIVLALPAWSQILLDSETRQGRAVIAEFDKHWDGKPEPVLACSTERIGPIFTFGSRLWAGYRALTPAKLFPGKDHRIFTMLKIAPKTGSAQPRYFWMGLDLPEIPPAAKQMIWMEGGVYVGPGDYEVSFMMGDRLGRLCRKRWSIHGGGRQRILQAANTVEPVRLESWKGFENRAGGPAKLTVLLHAAPIVRRRYVTRLSAYDRTVLLQSLTSLIDKTHFTQIRVVVFDFRGKRVLFRSDDFNAQAYQQLYRNLLDADYGRISFRTLLEGIGPEQMVERLVRDELKSKVLPDALVFLSPIQFPAGGPPPDRTPGWAEGAPKSYYLTFTPFPGMSEDIIERFVKRVLRGRALYILRPEDLAKAIRTVDGK